MSPFQKIIRDPAIWALLFMNIFFIAEYRADSKQYTTIIWLYWCQSVLLGVFNFFDMLTLKNVSVENITFNDKPASIRQTKGCLPVFFLFHYSIFHIVYFVFLMVDFKLTDLSFSMLKWAVICLLLNQLIFFVQNKIKYAEKPRHISIMFFMPYLRIVPMHVTILLPKFIGWTPALTFLVLKTFLDLTGHLLTNRYYWEREEENPGQGYI